MRGFLLRHSFMRTVDRLTKLAYRLSGGRVGRRQGKFKMLLLTTTGRKTGRARVHTLLYIRDGERYVVCASNFGAPVHPAWYLNLRDEPRALVQDGRRRLAVVAADAAGEERERLWKRLAEVWPFFRSYQRGNPRQIPVVVLAPASVTEAADKEQRPGGEDDGAVGEQED
jgi:deazaflavin-dependent oxidoreductase (nitroreductase family)